MGFYGNVKNNLFFFFFCKVCVLNLSMDYVLVRFCEIHSDMWLGIRRVVLASHFMSVVNVLF